MPAKWIRVRDTRTDDILPNEVPASFLEKFDYLKEVPSSRSQAEGIRLEEPAQPAMAIPVITEPEAAENTDLTPITEPGKPGKKAGGTHA